MRRRTIISDEATFDAVLVSVGRMGVIYSLVIEVVDQFILEENRSKASWNAVSASVLAGGAPPAGTISDFRANNRFGGDPGRVRQPDPAAPGRA